MSAPRSPYSSPEMPVMHNILPGFVLLMGGLCGVLAAPCAARADNQDTDAVLCRDLTLEPPLRVEACARALKAPGLLTLVQVDLLSQRAMALDELGDYKRAVQDYDAAIVLAPNDPALHLNRGVAKIRGGSPAAAIPDYDEAIRLRPDWHLPYFDRAVALSDLGQRAAALADYQRAIDRNPNDPWIYVGQGDVHAAGGDAAAALAAYDEALALRPDLDQAQMRRAKTLLRLDRPQEAVAAMDRALAAVGPNAAESSAVESGITDVAADAPQRADKPDWLQIRAAAKFALADFAGAGADLTQASEAAPQDTDLLRDLTRALLAAGDIKAADAAAMRAVQIAGDDAANLIAAGHVALADGRRPEAEALARRAVALRPGDAQAQALLALSLSAGAESAKAARAAADFAPQDAEIQAVAAALGAKPAGSPPAPDATPAEQSLAACIAALQKGDAATAAAAGARWSLCHLVATQTR
jgi:tetratricopeptide (TPR) repeat protein